MDALASMAEYETAALAAIGSATTAADLEAVRIDFLGKKKGRLKDLQSVLGQVSPEERPVIGKKFNDVKERVSAQLEARQAELSTGAARKVEHFDITLPGVPLRLGHRHPISQTIDEFREIMARLGFSLADGPEIEDEHHNFEALNIPPEHPARDPLDNFYVHVAQTTLKEPLLLRSQTSTVQIRVMEKTPPPIRIISIGRVYRPDTPDATHSCMFHQMEGLMVGPDVTMADLKTVLTLFARSYLGDVETRFRPSFFPFTEPSLEFDVRWGKDWMELGGAGMVDPNVFRAVGYDPEQVTGFAFGMGLERFCMKRFEVTDIRDFFENDIRFLEQF
jgi:phenylalanyl-tRNA synthetase alpha chain